MQSNDFFLVDNAGWEDPLAIPLKGQRRMVNRWYMESHVQAIYLRAELLTEYWQEKCSRGYKLLSLSRTEKFSSQQKALEEFDEVKPLANCLHMVHSLATDLYIAQNKRESTYGIRRQDLSRR